MHVSKIITAINCLHLKQVRNQLIDLTEKNKIRAKMEDGYVVFSEPVQLPTSYLISYRYDLLETLFRAGDITSEEFNNCHPIEWLPKICYMLEQFDFSKALQQIKAGEFITMADWPRGQFVFLLRAGTIPKTAIHDSKLREVLKAIPGEEFKAESTIRMMKPDGTIITGWMPNMEELFSEEYHTYIDG